MVRSRVSGVSGRRFRIAGRTMKARLWDSSFETAALRPPQDEVQQRGCQTLMVRSAAAPRVSNHAAAMLLQRNKVEAVRHRWQAQEQEA